MFAINQLYDFTTLAPSILGASYSNMKVIGIVTFDEAIKHTDVATLHTAVHTVIPATPVLPNDLVYIIFSDVDGVELVLAQDYIDPTTIVAMTNINLDIKMFNVSSNMSSIIKLRLKELGITNFTVTPF